MTNKTLHRKLMTEQHEPPKKNWGWGGGEILGALEL